MFVNKAMTATQSHSCVNDALGSERAFMRLRTQISSQEAVGFKSVSASRLSETHIKLTIIYS